MDDDANAHHEDEVNGNEEKIGFEEDVTEKSKKCHYFVTEHTFSKTRIPYKFKIKFILKNVWIMAIYAMVYLQDFKNNVP